MIKALGDFFEYYRCRPLAFGLGHLHFAAIGWTSQCIETGHWLDLLISVHIFSRRLLQGLNQQKWIEAAASMTEVVNLPIAGTIRYRRAFDAKAQMWTDE